MAPHRTCVRLALCLQLDTHARKRTCSSSSLSPISQRFESTCVASCSGISERPAFLTFHGAWAFGAPRFVLGGGAQRAAIDRREEPGFRQQRGRLGRGPRRRRGGRARTRKFMNAAEAQPGLPERTRCPANSRSTGPLGTGLAPAMRGCRMSRLCRRRAVRGRGTPRRARRGSLCPDAAARLVCASLLLQCLQG
jgi:hypothetical protein